ncbi:DUF6531 domain-containing protein, partial [Massilia sp. DJPM01]|uniref:DUF6531 domain-containing protein n=1 Tax=Massilia sp. DJPM01 TaxID=3024404 RepID=UPI00259DDE01|nr:DUF6531 domain-containing protein [Massilia sp. DJPM01]
MSKILSSRASAFLAVGQRARQIWHGLSVRRLGKAIVFMLLASCVFSAQAKPPKVKYWAQFGSWSTGKITTVEVNSLQGACSAAAPMYAAEWQSDVSNPRVDYATWNAAHPAGQINIPCIFKTFKDDNDTRSGGLARCPQGAHQDAQFYIDPPSQTCHCPAGKKYFEDVDTCVPVTPAPQLGEPSNNGPSCPESGAPQPKCGKPINPATGNMWHIENDYASASPVSTLAIRRTYNSDPLNWDAAAVRSFGNRWTQPYDAVLRAETVLPTGTGYAMCWRREDTKAIVLCETSNPIPSLLPGAASIVRGDGKRHFFKLEGSVWKGNAQNSDTLTSTYNSDKTAVIEWIYQSARGDVTERYSAVGQLISTTNRNGVTQRFTYSNGATNDSNVGRSPANAPLCSLAQAGATLPAGKLMCVTDSLGFKLHFEYDARGRIVKAIDPAGQPYVYEYDGASGGCVSPDENNAACTANNLTKVTYPDATSRTYMYNESAQINGGVACTATPGVANGFGRLLNAWTGYIDENGDRHISWTYDCLGRATSSELADGVEKVKVAYKADQSNTSAIVEHYTGLPSSPVTTSTTYNFTRILGNARNTSIDKPCIECGDYAARTYDVNGNDSTLKDWQGNLSCFAYDLSRNLETMRIEGATSTASCPSLMAATSLTAPLRKTNTKWHAKYRLPLQISEPKKRTTYEYDEAGNLVTRTEQATNDATGVLGFNAALVGLPRKWKYEVNSMGQVL